MAELEWKVKCELCGELFWAKELVLVRVVSKDSVLLCARCLIYFLGSFVKESVSYGVCNG